MFDLGEIEVHAGDFSKGKHSQFVGNKLVMSVPGKWFRQNIPAKEIATVELATEESVKRLGGTVGWGLAGAALLGPAGLLAGLLLGGRGKKVTFVCELKDGRRFMASTSSKTYTALAAAVFK